MRVKKLQDDMGIKNTRIYKYTYTYNIYISTHIYINVHKKSKNSNIILHSYRTETWRPILVLQISFWSSLFYYINIHMHIYIIHMYVYCVLCRYLKICISSRYETVGFTKRYVSRELKQNCKMYWRFIDYSQTLYKYLNKNVLNSSLGFNIHWIASYEHRVYTRILI